MTDGDAERLGRLCETMESSQGRQVGVAHIDDDDAVGGAAVFFGLGTTDEEEELTHTEGLIGFAQLGLSSNRDERTQFDKLICGGIPLVYRSKLWLECSGGSRDARARFVW
jgi:hypothetical protein